MKNAAIDGLPPGRRRLAFASTLVTVGMAVVDSSAVNVALPVIAAELRIESAEAIWIVSAYQLALVMALLPLSSLGEIHGLRKVYLTGAALFVVASVASALSGSLTMLVVARTVQGLGAAGIMSVNSALVRAAFPRSLLGSALGFVSMATATASTLGPSYASLVLSVASWHWVFLLNAPTGLAAIAIGFRSLPETAPSRRPFDILGAIVTASGMGLLVTAISSFGHRLSWPWAVVQLGLVAAAATWLVRRQGTAEAPLLPVDLLRRPVFALSICTSIACFTAQMLAFVSLPFHLHHDLGYAAETAGLVMMPWPMAVVVAAPLSGRLADRISAGWLGCIGLTVMSLGLLLLFLLPEQASTLDIAWRMAVCGAGFGFFQTPNNRLVIGAVPIARSGAASGLNSTARMFGQSTGAALVALLLARLPENGAWIALIVASGVALVAAVVSVLRVGASRAGRG